MFLITARLSLLTMCGWVLCWTLVHLCKNHSVLNLLFLGYPWVSPYPPPSLGQESPIHTVLWSEENICLCSVWQLEVINYTVWDKFHSANAFIVDQLASLCVEVLSIALLEMSDWWARMCSARLPRCFAYKAPLTDGLCCHYQDFMQRSRDLSIYPAGLLVQTGCWLI